MSLRTALGVGLLLVAILVPLRVEPILAQPSAPRPAVEASADRAFQHGDWIAAAAAYQALTTRQPEGVQGWVRWGTALHALGRFGEAQSALERALQLGAAAPTQVLLARVHARLGHATEAFAALEKAAAGGLGAAVVQRLASEEDVAALRADARWGAAMVHFDRNSRPCLYAPEFRQFDFWIGEWDVVARGAPAGTTPASSSIQSILEGCVILESWTSPALSGKSFNVYDAATRQWRQLWVDTQGTWLEFRGEVRDGTLYYTAASPTSGGSITTLHKLTFFRDDVDGVRQLWEQSTDQGKTWTVAFDGIYSRKLATVAPTPSLTR